MTDNEKDKEIASLPVLRHTIKLFEEKDSIVLDISDETGGLGLRLYLHPSVASKLGQDLANKARFYASKQSTDPDRLTTQTYQAGN